MDILLIILGSVCIIVGILGCFLPIIPGPPVSFVGLLLLEFTEKSPFDSDTLWMWGLIAAGVTALDYVVPVYGTKKFGGTKRGVWGSTIGLIVGLFFGPLGIILGPFIGAFLGEMSTGKATNKEALRAAFGAFVGFLVGVILKLIVSGWMAWIFFQNVFF
ncbi:DUF456 domain-containing protein [Roseivirga misakiensis]|uniref:DUF456 domain-containing protein n=1 Tax=Roseivirga misakiensis TaxID=1563681 RepID=A0A1E5SZF2_9BACT|nr:DUF456 domain-containing protein [Roseivirga misakiensis]OEK04508.1 hypothetical protein BFP71_13650 [Roseivirga misakiensis]